MFEPQIDFPQASPDTRDDFKINPDKEDAIFFKSPTLTDVKTKKADLFHIEQQESKYAMR